MPLDSHLQLLANNKAWARRQLEQDPDYFKRLAAGQQPKVLWIGCGDSRMPADRITGTQPGEVFVQRNVANLVNNTDLNLLTVLEFALWHLEVEHVIVCGHYGCGGITAALSSRSYGVMDPWLRNIKVVYRLHQAELDALPDEKARADRLCELNIIEGVRKLCEMATIQKAWKEQRKPSIHGWVYGVQDGIIQPLVDVDPGAPLETIFRYTSF